MLTGVRVQDRASARTAAEHLLNRGVRIAAVQAGDAGNLLIWREDQRVNEHWLPQLPVESTDATGAGDAFAAALAIALIEGSSLADAGAFANAAAALTTTAFGVDNSLPSRDAVLALLAQTNSQEQPTGSQEEAPR